MTVPELTGVPLGDPGPGPLLVLGPSLGTAAEPLWGQVATRIGDRFRLLGWELPGHGRSTSAGDAYTMAELAAGVLALVDRVLDERGETGGSFAYAGDSLGGAVGLQLLLDHPGRVSVATLLCTGAKIGEPDGWHERAALVRDSGTSVLVSGAPQRWFADGFPAREPDAAAALLAALQHADREGYAQACEALAGFDVRDRLAEIGVPVTAVAGAHDAVTPVLSLAQIAGGVRHGRLVVLDRVAHLAPVEAPDAVADLLVAGPVVTEAFRYDAGMAVRRAVLGDAHVDRADAATTDFTADFQELITRYAWGTIWTRPGLDRRSRSLITLTALVARGHHEELALHLRAALTNGLTRDEIRELLLQTAIYCGVPDANTAFRIAQGVLDEPGSPTP